jgi:hypothetical protein
MQPHRRRLLSSLAAPCLPASVRPPPPGGEKTVAALALLFAIHSYRPSPFFVLDEVGVWEGFKGGREDR